jgi:hypothetical protein
MVHRETSTCSSAALFGFDRFPKLFGSKLSSLTEVTGNWSDRSAARIRTEKLANLNVLTAPPWPINHVGAIESSPHYYGLERQTGGRHRRFKNSIVAGTSALQVTPYRFGTS